jgi:hypothetical protein
LAKLLNEGDEFSGSKPKIEIDIKKTVVEFWDELKIKFMPSLKQEERVVILKVLILVY